MHLRGLLRAGANAGVLDRVRLDHLLDGVLPDIQKLARMRRTNKIVVEIKPGARQQRITCCLLIKIREIAPGPMSVKQQLSISTAHGSLKLRTARARNVLGLLLGVLPAAPPMPV